jgi:N-hydroxyarylamine O-acetyltransferase
MTFDLTAYYSRIGIANVAPDIDGLRAMQAAQMGAIPFENIDPLLGRVPDLAAQAVRHKLITARRGGYCFEQNALFGEALAAIGFKARTTLARVRNGAARGGPRTHQIWIVTLGGEDWLADAGFGGPGATAPVNLADRSPQPMPNGLFRMRLDSETGETVFERETPHGWFSLFGFDGAAVTAVDIEAANFVCARWDKAPFASNLMMAIHRPAGRVSLFNTSVKRLSGAGEEHASRIGSCDELDDVLAGEFGLSLDPSTVAALWDRIAARAAERAG